MTTSTLDLIDWDTCLDDEPACEWQSGCGSHEERYCEIAARRLAQDVLDFGDRWALPGNGGIG